MKIAEVMVKAGLVSPETLSELQRWGAPVPDPEDEQQQSPSPIFPEEVVRAIDQALEEQGLVVVRETDLEALGQYVASMKQGRLFVTIDDQSADFAVDYGMLKSGEYLLPWRSDSITDVLGNGQTHLVDADGRELYFSSARELFYGDTKAFVACMPSGQ